MALAKYYEDLNEARTECGMRKMEMMVWSLGQSNTQFLYDDSPSAYQAKTYEKSKSAGSPQKRGRSGRKGKSN